jgi:UDP-N-acetylmuramate--alanine ligase
VILSPLQTQFTFHHHNYKKENCILGIGGHYNLINALAAIAAVYEEYKNHENKPDLESLLKKLASYSGVKRRFDYKVFRDDFIFIDDYAHHPKEIESFLKSVKNIFPDKQICGVFQPHLYSRTRDFAEEFARALELLDEVILLDIYPAREKPIEGVTSVWLLSLIRKKNKRLLSKQELISYLQARKPELLVTMGAGDIDLILDKIIKNGKQ